jgi:hypothetical protein
MIHGYTLGHLVDWDEIDRGRLGERYTRLYLPTSSLGRPRATIGERLDILQSTGEGAILGSSLPRTSAVALDDLKHILTCPRSS